MSIGFICVGGSQMKVRWEGFRIWEWGSCGYEVTGM